MSRLLQAARARHRFALRIAKHRAAELGRLRPGDPGVSEALRLGRVCIWADRVGALNPQAKRTAA